MHCVFCSLLKVFRNDTIVNVFHDVVIREGKIIWNIWQIAVVIVYQYYSITHKAIHSFCRLNIKWEKGGSLIRDTVCVIYCCYEVHSFHGVKLIIKIEIQQ